VQKIGSSASAWYLQLGAASGCLRTLIPATLGEWIATMRMSMAEGMLITNAITHTKGFYEGL